MKELPYIVLYIGAPIIIGLLIVYNGSWVNDYIILQMCDGNFRNCLPGKEDNINFFHKIPFWLAIIAIFLNYICYKIFEADKIIGSIVFLLLGLGSILLFLFYLINVLNNYT